MANPKVEKISRKPLGGIPFVSFTTECGFATRGCRITPITPSLHHSNNLVPAILGPIILGVLVQVSPMVRRSRVFGSQFSGKTRPHLKSTFAPSLACLAKIRYDPLTMKQGLFSYCFSDLGQIPGCPISASSASFSCRDALGVPDPYPSPMQGSAPWEYSAWLRPPCSAGHRYR